MSARTEPASPRRQRRAREAGDFPASQLLNSALILAASICVLPAAISSLWNLGKCELIAAFDAQPRDLAALQLAAMHGLEHLIAQSLPLLCVAAGASWVAQSSQAQAMLLSKAAQSVNDGLGLARGARQLFSVRAISALAVHCAEAATFVGLGWFGWSTHARSLAETLGRISQAPKLSASLAWQLACLACWVGLVFGALDWLIANQVWRWRLRVSRAERLREQRETQGDPRWKAERGRLAQAAAAAPTVTALHDVTVVVYAGYQVAIAIRYDASEMAAPRVVRVERGLWAKKLVEEFQHIDLARIVQNASLAHALAHTDIGAPIAEALYPQVAELLGAIAGR